MVFDGSTLLIAHSKVQILKCITSVLEMFETEHKNIIKQGQIMNP